MNKNKNKKCKHSGTYSIFEPIESSSSFLIDTLKKDNNFESFFQNCIYMGEKTYNELTESDKKIIDAQWDDYSTSNCCD